MNLRRPVNQDEGRVRCNAGGHGYAFGKTLEPQAGQTSACRDALSVGVAGLGSFFPNQKIMKSRIGLIGLVGLVGLLSAGAQQQAAAPPADSTSFFGSVTSYFSSFNPELEGTFTNRGMFWTSVDSIQGGSNPLANSIGMSYGIWKQVSVEGVFRNAGVAGAIVDAQGGLGFSFVVHDVKLTAYVDGGYGFAESRDPYYAEAGVRIMKALTTHTFAGVGIAGQFPGNRQVLSAFVGFTF